jgi:hypothetical protein
MTILVWTTFFLGVVVGIIIAMGIVFYAIKTTHPW